MSYMTPSTTLSQKFQGLAIGSEPSILEGILLVGAKDTPMLREIKRVNINNVKSVWLTDKLRNPRNASASANEYVRDFAPNTSNTSTENENVVQIFRDDVSVANVFDKISVASKEKEYERQLSKASIEHIIDIETAFWGTQSPVLASNDTEKNVVGGLWHFIPNSNKTDYANAELTFNHILDIQQKVYDAGGNPNKIFCGAVLKRKINDILDSKRGARFIQSDPEKVNFMITSIETDFGLTDIVLTRYLNGTLANRIFCGDVDSIELGVLQDTTVQEQHTNNLARSATIHSAMTFHFRNAHALSAGINFKVS